jgi:hypothetical protein
MICVVDGVYWAKSDLFQPEIETTTNMKSSATIALVVPELELWMNILLVPCWLDY